MADSDNSKKRPDEDTQAILDRRRFLIQSTLATAGIVAGAGGCRPEPEVCLTPAPPEPQVCLSVAAPEPCLDVSEPQEPPMPPDGSGGNQPEPETCLDVSVPQHPEPEPEVCLSLMEDAPMLPPEPEVCLSVEATPQPCLSDVAPEVCLRVAPKNITPNPEPCLSPQPCLSPPEPPPPPPPTHPGICLSIQLDP